MGKHDDSEYIDIENTSSDNESIVRILKRQGIPSFGCFCCRIVDVQIATNSQGWQN